MNEIKNLNIDAVYLWEGDDDDYSMMRVKWSANIGFGQLDIYNDDEGHWKAYTECMCGGEDKEFIKMVLDKWVEQMEVVG